MAVDVGNRVIRLYLAAAIPAVPAHFLLPQPFAALALLWLSILAVAATVYGIRLHQTRFRRPWYLLAGAQGLFLMGHLASHAENLWHVTPPTVPSSCGGATAAG